jgi:hypothetical protein
MSLINQFGNNIFLTLNSINEYGALSNMFQEICDQTQGLILARRYTSDLHQPKKFVYFFLHEGLVHFLLDLFQDITSLDGILNGIFFDVAFSKSPWTFTFEHSCALHSELFPMSDFVFCCQNLGPS